jgi:hypothetical protein
LARRVQWILKGTAMSEYQYYEFCSLNAPLSQEARKTMAALSSRAKVGTHGASYVYHYGDFRGNPKQLLLKYFDVFFYIANWGTVKLMFKYPIKQVDVNKLKNYCIKGVISCKQDVRHVLLDIYLHKEEGWGWIEGKGEGKLPDILPLYDEIKRKNYKFLSLVSAINDEFSSEKENSLKTFSKKNTSLSSPQRAFLDILELNNQEN